MHWAACVHPAAGRGLTRRRETGIKFGIGAAELSASIEGTLTNSVEQAVTASQSASIKCIPKCTQVQDQIWAYFMYASPRAGGKEQSLPGNCLFECISAGNVGPPKCPPGYCDPTYGQCDCCSSLEWAQDPDAQDLPPLCGGVDGLSGTHTDQPDRVTAGASAGANE